jgi:hypothetical protein
MEDVLDVYKRPYNPRRPTVCFDERPKQLVGEIRQPIPAAPGKPARYDYEYKRNGVANLFMMFEPLAGKRHVKVTDRRTKKDWAWCIADKLEIHHTPKHGSWLNMAEIEISVLGRQCLAERMENISRLETEAIAWAEDRNAKCAKVDWQFTSSDARIKLKNLYPLIEA